MPRSMPIAGAFPSPILVMDYLKLSGMLSDFVVLLNYVGSAGFWSVYTFM